MKINENGLNLIKSFEGLSLSPYHDDIDPPSICTIGYGTIMYENGEYVKLTDPDITEQRAVELLQWEVTDKAKQIDPLLRDDLTGNQFAALISFSYNLGVGSLKQSTLRKKVNINPLDPTIKDEFAKWVYSDGVKVSGLIRRRKAEADLYLTS